MEARMPFDPIFTRETLLPLAVHSYVEAGLLQPCDTFPPASVSFVKPVTPILVDPATCRKVWNDLHAQAFGPAGPASAIEARSMLEAVMADSHVFGFVGMTAESTFICFRGTHFLSEWLE